MLMTLKNGKAGHTINKFNLREKYVKYGVHRDGKGKAHGIKRLEPVT